jgi:hypothetical protein
MIWRRKKAQPDETVSMVQAYASKLGIERRRTVRIQYPGFSLASLPAIYYGPHLMKVFDLSVGGVGLLDEENRMGSDTGNTIELKLVWPDCTRTVRCKLVARVHDRRHIQFLDLAEERVEALRRAIAPGALGQAMKSVLKTENSAVELAAKEVWSSLSGDSLVLTLDVHKQADLHINGRDFKIMKSAWPLNANGKPASSAEFEEILIFLTNIFHPSTGVSILKSQLQRIYLEGLP